MNIHFKIKNQQIERLDNNKLVEKSREYVNAFFTFSEDWQDHKKTITFTSKEDDVSYNVELTEDKCLVPWEVITSAGFLISGFGEGKSFITLNEIEVKVEESGLTEDGEIPGTPTPTQWELYKEEVEALIGQVPMVENVTSQQSQDGKNTIVSLHTTDKKIYNIDIPNGKEGPEGPQGDRGPQGLRGEIGPKGDTGLQGEKGDRGDKGEPGPKGDTGVGIKEITAAPSGNGKTTLVIIHTTDNNTYYVEVPNGEQGEKGESGEKGEDGVGIDSIKYYQTDSEGNVTLQINYTDEESDYITISGIKGEDGIDGKSAYEIALDNGFKGTEEKWLDSLKGIEGPMGPMGPQGESGQNGADGKDGKGIDSMGYYDTDGDGNIGIAVFYTDGTIGFVWIPGLKGEKGDKGDKGDTGKGIMSINSFISDGEIYIDIFYTDGDFYRTSFPQPKDGENGYTPVKGIDYWTDEDKAEIKGYVDEAILGGAW